MSTPTTTAFAVEAEKARITAAAKDIMIGILTQDLANMTVERNALQVQLGELTAKLVEAMKPQPPTP